MSVVPLARPAPLESLFDMYFKYVEDTESPLIYHRWSMITAVGAFLGRSFYFRHGSNRIFPNSYVMLIGSAGARKSSAIKGVRRLLSQAGYDHFAAERTTREKFLLDLEGESDDGPRDAYGKEIPGRRDPNPRDILASLDLGTGDSGHDGVPKEVFVVADEFNEFAGSGNMDFLSTLGALWDWDDETATYKHRFKNSKSISIYQPTISIIGGNTHSSFQAAFPAAAVGQGFLSRLILVHSEPSGKKIAFPTQPDERIAVQLLERFHAIRESVKGEASITPEAKRIMGTIYSAAKEQEDYRLVSYSSRRFTHLIKLVLVCAAMRVSTEITVADVILANTILTYTERDMPKALGEYGKDPNSEAKQNIMAALYAASEPLSFNQLFKIVQRDLIKSSMLPEILGALASAGKVNRIGPDKFTAKQKAIDTGGLYIDMKLLKEIR